MKFTDRAQIGGMKETQDGYLVGQLRCARTGLQQYLGSELGLPTNDVISVYRPESEVFSRESLASYANKPISDDHPPEFVTSDNWSKYGKGDIGSDVVRDGEFVSVSYKIMDGDTIAKVKAGKAEVSMGYMAEIDFQDGVTPDGEPYQAIQKNIRINHLAIVDRGRAGPECRISDSNWGTSPITKVLGDNQVTLKTLIVDGLTVETTEQGLAAVNKIADAKNEAVKALNDAKVAHDAAIATKDAELAKKDAEIDALKAAKLSDAEIDAKVQARSDLLTKAKSVADTDFTGLSDADIKKAAVVAKLGDAAIEGKTEAYIDARFDILVESADKADPFAKAMSDKQTTVTDNGQAEYEENLRNAWKKGA
nr:DUF2213 domain-containing protein [uncultured Psychrobacter sp.]